MHLVFVRKSPQPAPTKRVKEKRDWMLNGKARDAKTLDFSKDGPPQDSVNGEDFYIGEDEVFMVFLLL